MKKLVALTGKTGAGKSTVSEYLRSKGAFVIDGDVVARDVLKTDFSLLPELKRLFGNDIELNGVLDRKKLAQKAFSTPENTKLLNSVFHPSVNKKIDELVQNAFSEYDIVIVDAAAVIESGYSEKCDALIAVTAPFDVRLERIKMRDGISESDALVRMNAQKDDLFYTKNADFVIVNDGDFKPGEMLCDVCDYLFGS